MSKETKLTVFIDHVGRTIIGQVVDKGDVLEVRNPVSINAGVDPNNRISINLIPLMFFELLANRERNVWFFNKSQIVLSDLELDSRLKDQYKQINNPPQPVAPPTSDPQVIKLFDE